MIPASLPGRIADAWHAAFGRPPSAVAACDTEVRVEVLALYPLDGDRWGVGVLVTAPPGVPGEVGEEVARPVSEWNSLNDALFGLLQLASIADEARRAIAGEPPRWALPPDTTLF